MDTKRVGRSLGWLGIALLVMGMFSNGWFIALDEVEYPHWTRNWGLLIGRTCDMPREVPQDCEFIEYKDDDLAKQPFRAAAWAAASFGLLAIGCLAGLYVQRRPTARLAKAAMGCAAAGMLMAVWFSSMMPDRLRTNHVGRLGYSFDLYLLGAFAVYLAASLLMPPPPSADDGPSL